MQKVFTREQSDPFIQQTVKTFVEEEWAPTAEFIAPNIIKGVTIDLLHEYLTNYFNQFERWVITEIADQTFCLVDTGAQAWKPMRREEAEHLFDMWRDMGGRVAWENDGSWHWKLYNTSNQVVNTGGWGPVEWLRHHLIVEPTNIEYVQQEAKG